MISDGCDNAKLSELLIALLEGSISAQELVELDKQIISNPDVRKYYTEFLTVFTGLRQPGAAFISGATLYANVADKTCEALLLEELAEYEKNAPPVDVERIEAKGESVLTEEERQAKIRAFVREQQAMEEQERWLEAEARRKILRRELRRRRRIARARTVAAKIRKVSTIGAIAAVGMVIAFYLYALLTPVPPASVATLTDGVNVKWADSDLPTELNSPLRPGTMKLVAGIAEITFDGGAKAIIEAPVEIKLQNASRAYLQSGKMSAIVPLEARGFTVNTPSASIVDLGTEFGVHVKKGGSSVIHVFKGQVSLMAGEFGRMVDNLGKKVAQIVKAGQAKRVLAGRIQDIQFGQTAFERNMPSPYELAIRKSKPVIHWRFNRDSKYTDGLQYFGNAKIETIGPDMGGGKPNDALKLGGDGYVFVGDVQLDAPRQGGCTIVLWVRPNIIRKQIIVLQDGSQDDSDAGLERLLLMDENGQLGFYQIANNRHIVKVLSDKTMQAGQWYHVAATIANDNVKLFINGQLQEAQVNTTSQTLNPALMWYTYIGSDPEYEEGKRSMLLPYSGRSVLWPYSSLNGAVDEVALFNRALSADEIRQLYMSVKQ